MSEPSRMSEQDGGAPQTAEGGGFIAAPRSKTLDLIIGIIVVAVSAAFALLSLGIASNVDAGGLSPQDWPLILSILAILLGLGLILEVLRGKAWDRDDLEAGSRAGWTRLALTAALIILYIVGWELIGFVIPTIVFLAALVFSYGIRRPIPLVLFPVITTLSIYVVFHMILRVPL